MIVGLEHHGGEEDRRIEVAPANQRVLRIHPRITEQSLKRRAGSGVDALHPWPDLLDPQLAKPPPGVVDLGAGRREPHRLTGCLRAEAAIEDTR